jgi:class 3 adenylate cyclase/tetratricopeptide (TPR) repeat protein
MFCDLVDSTALSSQLDPEDYREVVREYQKVCSEVITRFDGHIAQLLGDGLLVYFGYPHAHEDDAQRAVRTGLGILEALGDFNKGLPQAKGLQLAIRMGIHTGLVVVGEMGGAGHQEQLALGEVPNIAARMQGLAAANTVAISEATYRLVQGYFDYQDLGAQTLRGVTEPVHVYRVLQDSGARGRLDVAVTRGLTPLVGREQEVGLLVERWDQVKAGHGHVVLLTGDAGIGKSRLVQMLKEHVAHEPHTRWECRSAEYAQNTAPFPLTDLFQRLLQFQTKDTSDEKVRKLEHALSQYRLPLEESVPLFAPLLSLPISENHYPPLNLPPQRQRQKTLEILVAILLELAEHQPVLFILEDLHWTDPSTLELLNLVLDQTPTASMLVLLTCRPYFQPSWRHKSYLSEVTVHRLSHAQVEQIVSRITDGKTFPQEVLAQIVAKTDGVPLFVEEMTKAILESGQLTAVDGHYELTGSLSTFAIPATLQDSLMARLDTLMTGKVIAQLGATIGRHFSYALLQAVVQLNARTLHEELHRLVEAEIVYQRGVPPQSTYVFKHALIQEAAYESLLKSTRQHYHQRIAQVLEVQFPETAEAQPELLAHHALRGEVWDKAVTYCQQAGARAHDRAAFREAMASFEQALQALAHLSEHCETRGLASDLRLVLGDALGALGAYGRCLALLREAEALARALDDRARLVRVLASMGRILRTTGDHDGAIAAGQQALAHAAALGESAFQMQASYQLGAVYFTIGNFGRAAELLRQTVEVADRESGTLSTDVRIRSRAWLARTLGDLGAFAKGRRHGEEALRLATREGRGATPIMASACLGILYLAQGDLEHAIRVLEPGLALCRAADNRDWLRGIVAGLGYASALQGRLAEGRALLEEGISEGIRTGALQNHSHWVAQLSEVCRLVGRSEEAGQHARQALALARQLKERGNEARARHQLGVVYAHADPPDAAQAEAHYHQALTLAEELGMRPLVAHCHRGLGTLYATTGQREQAHAELSTAIAMYRAMEMTFWLPQTEAALAQVEGR